MEIQQSNFEGWAVVELFGHQGEVGFVTTQVFGSAVLFRIDTPELPEREYTLERPEQILYEGMYRWAGIGSKVKRTGVPAKTKLVGPSAIYAMTPCTEQTARVAIERMIAPPLIILELAAAPPQITGGERCEGCGRTPEQGHLDGCAYDLDQDEIER